jgi:multiple sugar transport system permease protein
MLILATKENRRIFCSGIFASNDMSALSKSSFQSNTDARSWHIVRRLWQKNKGMVFILPAMALWLFVGLYPVAMSVSLAFHKWNGFSKYTIFPKYVCELPGCRYVGWRNFERILEPGTPPHDTFMSAVFNNLTMMIIGTAGVILIALPLAMAMNNAVRGARFFRTLLLFPMATSGVAIYYVWKLIYQPEGVLNGILDTVGLDRWVVANGWLGDINTALYSLIVVTIWAGVPFSMLLYLAGLQTIPQEVLEASIVDGANAFHRMRHIIWPLLRPITVIIMVMSFSGALQGFEMPLLMTDGGPTGHTTVVGLLVYQKAFGGWGTPDMGLASAYGWILFVMGIGLSAITLRSMRTVQ